MDSHIISKDIAYWCMNTLCRKKFETIDLECLVCHCLVKHDISCIRCSDRLEILVNCKCPYFSEECLTPDINGDFENWESVK